MSPASSARSSSAATRISSITSGRVSANSAVSSVLAQLLAVAALLDRPRRDLGFDPALGAAARAAPRDEAPVLELDHVEDALLHPLGVHVLRDRRRAARSARSPGAPAPCAPGAGWGTAPPGEMWSPLAERPPRSVGAGLDQLGPPVGEVGRHLDADVRHQPPGLGDQPLHVVDRDRRSPSPGQGGCLAVRDPARPARPRRLVGDLGDLSGRSTSGAGRSSGGSPPGCGRGARCTSASASSEAMRSSSVSPMPTRMPLVNGILSSPAASIVSRRRAGCLVGEPAWTVSISRSEIDSSISPCDAVTSRSRARSSRREHAEVRVRQDAALERPLAGPDDVGGEVLVPVLREPRRDLGVDLGPLAGQHEQLLGVAPLGLVELPLDLLGRVEVRLMGRERAVLAVALAGPRQRQRVVAAERDPAHAGSR